MLRLATFPKAGPSSLDTVLVRGLIPNMELKRLPVATLPDVARAERLDRMERRSASMKFSGLPRCKLFWLASGLAKTDGLLLLTLAGEAGPVSRSTIACAVAELTGPGIPGSEPSPGRTICSCLSMKRSAGSNSAPAPGDIGAPPVSFSRSSSDIPSSSIAAGPAIVMPLWIFK